MSIREPLAVLRFLQGSEDARESELQIKRIGHLLLRVTPLVEPWAPWGVVLGFQGFRVSPQKNDAACLKPFTRENRSHYNGGRGP